MCCASSDDYFADTVETPPFEQVQVMVEAEFDVEEGFIDHDIPTFYVRYREDSKEGFLRLMKRLDSLELIPLLRQKEEKVVLRVLRKPPTKPSRNIINIALFFATLGTVFASGYFYSLNILSALLFTGAIMAILGSHEMGHKLLADKHDVEATYPYFIPGLPLPWGIGTFGAVIKQKSLPPNRDALFDIGFTGPLMSFLISLPFLAMGFLFSSYEWIPKGSPSSPPSLLLVLIQLLGFQPLGEIPPVPTVVEDFNLVINLHPVALAGWIGLLVTLLNLVPSGMFDGGHVARSLVGPRSHQILSYLGIALLLPIAWPMAILALFFASVQHPGPLDDISRISSFRKVVAVLLVIIFILIYPLGAIF